jgi:hypothetical protein
MFYTDPKKCITVMLIWVNSLKIKKDNVMIRKTLDKLTKQL